jgi:ABC-type dipeptide/oligopeptide/nickel transport system permease subunit
MKKFALSIGGDEISAPSGVPTGGLDKLAEIIQTGIALSFFLAIIAALFILLLSGFQWIFSGGDKQKLQQARQRLTYTIVGLALIFLSLLIIQFLGDFFGIIILDLPGT